MVQLMPVIASTKINNALTHLAAMGDFNQIHQVVASNRDLQLSIVVSSIILTVTYIVLKQYFGEVKQRAWILTGVASMVLSSVAAARTFQQVNKFGFDVTQHAGQHGNDHADIYLCGFFIAYLIMDLLIGTLQYRSQITLGSGWLHHLGYILLTLHLINEQLTSLYTLMFLMEIPTIVLAIGKLNKNWRSDLLFGVTFGATRILMHGIVIWQLYAYFPIDGQWWLLLGSVFPLHLHWFLSWVRQQVRMRQVTGKKTM